jgi:hypothetical protein
MVISFSSPPRCKEFEILCELDLRLELQQRTPCVLEKDNQVFVRHRPFPPAMLLATETAALRIWLVRPYNSHLGNILVQSHTCAN